MASNRTFDTAAVAAAAWLAARDSERWEPTDQSAFEAWLESSVAHRIAYIRAQAAWKQADRLKALGAGIQAGTVPAIGELRFSPFFEAGMPVQISTATGAYRSRHTLTKWMRCVVAAVVLAVAGTVGWHTFVTRAVDYHTAVGGMEMVPLADGSTITLNTDSEVRVALDQTARNIRLDRGEAFFEVAKDPGRPFVVNVGDRRVIAVGTKFSVRRDGNEIRVAVAEGHVRIEAQDAKGEPPAHLQPGDIANSDHDGFLVQQKSLALLEEEELGWRQGFVSFRDTALGDVVKEFNRYNVVKISVADAEVASIRIGGSFRVTNVDAFLRLVEEGVSVHTIKEGDQIILKRD